MFEEIVTELRLSPSELEDIKTSKAPKEQYCPYFEVCGGCQLLTWPYDKQVEWKKNQLKEVFELEDINDLPIEFNIAWYEQKAVIVLLALLYLGVKNIHLGPTLPGFLSPNVAKVLIDTFGIAGIGTVEDDIKLFMA